MVLVGLSIAMVGGSTEPVAVEASTNPWPPPQASVS